MEGGAGRCRKMERGNMLGASLIVLALGLPSCLCNLSMLRSSIPGEPGLDFPILGQIQESGFTCLGLTMGGYYADTEQRCQVYHVCLQDGNSGLHPVSFLCPNGTVFNQEVFVCDWWFHVDCSLATSHYSMAEAAWGGGHTAPPSSPSSSKAPAISLPPSPAQTSNTPKAPSLSPAPSSNQIAFPDRILPLAPSPSPPLPFSTSPPALPFPPPSSQLSQTPSPPPPPSTPQPPGNPSPYLPTYSEANPRPTTYRPPLNPLLLQVFQRNSPSPELPRLYALPEV